MQSYCCVKSEGKGRGRKTPGRLSHRPTRPTHPTLLGLGNILPSLSLPPHFQLFRPNSLLAQCDESHRLVFGYVRERASEGGASLPLEGPLERGTGRDKAHTARVCCSCEGSLFSVTSRNFPTFAYIKDRPSLSPQCALLRPNERGK